LTAFVALLASSFAMYRRMAAAEKEVVQLRKIAGHLDIEDKRIFYAIAVENEYYDITNSWRWRIFLPPGFCYILHFEIEGDQKYFDERQMWNEGNAWIDCTDHNEGIEGILRIALAKTANDHAYLVISFKSIDGEFKEGYNFEIPIEIFDHFTADSTATQFAFGNEVQQSEKLDKPIVLFETQDLSSNYSKRTKSNSDDLLPTFIIRLGKTKESPFKQHP
jgi:hypothetical protein